jgi:hypothetical protein
MNAGALGVAKVRSAHLRGRTLTPTRDGSSFRSSLRSSEHGKSVCVLRLGPQADNAVTLGEGDGFIHVRWVGAPVFQPDDNARRWFSTYEAW